LILTACAIDFDRPAGLTNWVPALPATDEALAPEAAAELANLATVLADNRYFLGRRVSEWIIKAPGLEQGVACAAVAGEEMGFARVLYGLVERIPAPGKPVPLVTGTDRDQHFCVSFLDQPFDSWARVVAALNLVDPALNLLSGLLARSPYDQLAQRSSRIVDEERFHDKFASGRLHDASDYDAEASRVQSAINELFPEMVMWFGRDRATRWPSLSRAAILPAGDEPLAQTYAAQTGERLRLAGFDVPPISSLPWQSWDPISRRLQLPADRATG